MEEVVDVMSLRFGLNTNDIYDFFFFFSSRRRHTRYWRDWSSDVCSSDLRAAARSSPSGPSGSASCRRWRPAGTPVRTAGRPSTARRCGWRGTRGASTSRPDRESGVVGKRVDLGGARFLKKKKKQLSHTSL